MKSNYHDKRERRIERYKKLAEKNRNKLRELGADGMRNLRGDCICLVDHLMNECVYSPDFEDCQPIKITYIRENTDEK